MVAMDIDTEEIYFYTPEDLHKGIKLLGEADELIGHNIISYDLACLRQLHDFYYDGELFDTLVVSRLLNPDRTGGHSIEAWGRKLGLHKPEHEDWSQFSKEMLHRCHQDVLINYRVYKALVKEGRLKR